MSERTTTSQDLIRKLQDFGQRLEAEHQLTSSPQQTRSRPRSRPGNLSFDATPRVGGSPALPPRNFNRGYSVNSTVRGPPVSTKRTRSTEEIRTGIEIKSNVLTFEDGKKYEDVTTDRLIKMQDLGTGTCGHVVKMLHIDSGKVMAVKQMRKSGIPEENRRIYMDLDVVVKCKLCPNIVHCYGFFVTDSDVWICMELMDTCFEKLQRVKNIRVPEEILGYVSVSVLRALHYLKSEHDVIHRDVKPSNILLDKKGNIKLCDFGIAGRLVDSKAKTGNAGVAAYIAPERVDPTRTNKGYDVRADVWSLGITLVELARGEHPYAACKSDFAVLVQVMDNPPPRLVDSAFSVEFREFVELCLTKDVQLRPKYKKLLEHPFIKKHEKVRDANEKVANWYMNYL